MSPRIPETFSSSSAYCDMFFPGDETPPRNPNDDEEDEDEEDEDEEDQPREPPIVREPDQDEL